MKELLKKLKPVEQQIIMCVNDKNKPDGIGDWPKEGKLYAFEDIKKNSTMDGSYGFVIVGLYPQGKWETYNANRFAEFARLNLN